MKKQKKQLLELAKQAYNSSDVCQEWKDKILEVCPKFKKPLEVGKWYWYGNCLLVWNNGDKTYGFNGDKRYGNNFFFSYKEAIQATDKEVEEALIKEAKKRGFKEDVFIKSAYRPNYSGIMDGSFKFEQNQLWTKSKSNPYHLQIFEDGKWAEIVSEPVKKMTVADVEKLVGCKVEIVNKH